MKDALIYVTAITAIVLVTQRLGGATLCASNSFAEFSARRRHGMSRFAKFIAMAICAVALLFVLSIAPRDAIDFQFLGGTWILQTLPALGLSLYRPRTDLRALLAGAVLRVIPPTRGRDATAGA